MENTAPQINKNENPLFSPQIIAAIFSPLIFFIMLFAYTKLAGPIPFNVTSVTTQKTDSFAVNGEGKVKIKPDSATVRVGVQAEGATTEEAQEKMNSKINDVVGAIKGLGIEESKIKTENYNIFEDFGVRPLPAEGAVSPQGKKTYRGNTNISVQVDDVELADKVLDTAVANGATDVGGVNFEVKDKSKAENEAREMAVKQAKVQAEQAAKIAGFQLGKLINYAEYFGPYPIAYSKMEAAGRGGDTSTPTQIQRGENEIVVNVTLYYEIK